jgi:hypothetical protein
MSDETVLLYLFVGSGMLLSLIAIPLMQRRVRPNLWYGFRVRQTLDNPDVWYAANAYAGRRLFWLGVVTIAAAIGLHAVPGLTLDGYALLVGGVALTVGVVIIVQSFRYLAALTRRP